MKNPARILSVVLLSAFLLSGCKKTPTTPTTSVVTAQEVYTGNSFFLVRVTIDGVDYIANSRGGIVRAERK